MNSLLIIAVVFLGYLIAYHTYGRFLAKKIFNIDRKNTCPSSQLCDNMDFIPTEKNILFGHHFTSIAGLGPIVGPVIAIIWGWVPALLWVFFGSIFLGAIHDFGSLIISMRSQGRSLGDLTAQIINPRVRNLFLFIIFFALWIIIAVFALIIAILFTLYPESVLPVWLQIPIAVFAGHLIYQKDKNSNWVGLGAIIAMYLSIVSGAYFPVSIASVFGLSGIAVWIVILLIYAYIASTLPVQILLQPRDFINAYQLLITMALLIAGVIVSHPPMSAPYFASAPQGAPAMFPFLFIIIACGAISGFHSLVSSGTTSKQCANESHCLFIGYGGMLIEGALAALVIVAVGAGLGLGLETKTGDILTGSAAFSHHYSDWTAANGLSAKLSAFVTGSSNMIKVFGIPVNIITAIIGVFLVSFAATTLDSATRIQRYVISEIAQAWNITPLTDKHSATFIAVFTAFVLAFSNGNGQGAMSLWPLFGTINQLLAALALLAITIYLIKKKVNCLYAAVPMFFMVLMTGWAMVLNIRIFFMDSNWLLFGIGVCVFLLEIWMIIESVFIFKQTD